MFHAHLPKWFWIDCFSTVVFLINRLLSKALNMQSPYLLLYGHHQNYSTFHVLGSQCFHFLGAYRENKLEPKSLLCVFLGYSTKHKGYKCLYPPTSRLYILRHVIFDESVLPCSSPGKLYGYETVMSDFSSFIDGDPSSSSAFESLQSVLASAHAPP